LEEKRIDLLTEFENIQQEWVKIWQVSNVQPLTPLEMLEWLQRYEKIKELSAQFDDMILNIQAREKKVTFYKHILITALEKLGLSSLEVTLTDLLNRAARSLDELEEKNHIIYSTLDKIAQIHKNMQRKEIEKQSKEEEIGVWTENWANAVDGIPAIADSSPTIANEIVKLHDQCVNKYEKMIEVEQELHIVEESIKGFKQKAVNLIHNYYHNLESMPVHFAVIELNNELQKAKEDRVNAEGLKAQIRDLKQLATEASKEIEIISAELDNLLSIANCTSNDELVVVIDKFHLKVEYMSKLQETNDDLLNSGGGLTIEQLTSECDGIEQDFVAVELQRIEATLHDLDSERFSFSQEHGVIQNEFLEISKGHSDATVKAEQDKESVLSQLEFHADQYITHKMAALLLQKGIEHYRNNNQSPIISRAAEIFARLTLYSYHGIIVDYDDKDEPVLMGVNVRGDKVPVNGMSDGTTDQLYLALRIASLEKYARENEPIPFIIDDILVHFDDDRAKEALKVLIELSSKTQVIFFTHHSKIIELLKEIESEDIFQLEEIVRDVKPSVTI
jgi:uncharacterized protein YhaN